MGSFCGHDRLFCFESIFAPEIATSSILPTLIDPIEGPQSLPPRSGPSVYSTAVGEIPASARTGLGAHWDTLGSKTDSQPS